MKKTISILAAFAALTVSEFIFCENISAQTLQGTYLFAKKDTSALYMDVYDPAPGSETTFKGKTKPTVLFVFGGGFKNGTRNAGHYMPWFKMLTDDGYKVVSIDYRLGMKGKDVKGIAFVKTMKKAIDLAVEDLFSATEYIIDNSLTLGIDPSNLVISGSSAGAITVLQGEYELCNRTALAKDMPKDYNYAGVMSFSGAIFSTHGAVKYEDMAPCPTMMLHGTADKVVNYKQVRILWVGFFGTDSITKRFARFGYDYNTLRYVDHGHDIASSMADTFVDQQRFLETNVAMNIKRVVDYTIDDPQIPVRPGSKNRKELYAK